ncbi:MAG: hypothetical protein IPH13_20500 [Planctomycetes bacterium]|nr:hypothetical protein [Planctomycetota bacterium]
MTTTQTYPIGLRLFASDHRSQVYADPTVVDTTSPGVLRPLDYTDGDVDAVWVRTDSGYAGTVWEHDQLLLPVNWGSPANAPVLLRVGYSDTLYDLTSAQARATVEAELLGPTWLNEDQAQDLDPGEGRYRYLRFRLGTLSGSRTSSLHDSAYTQYVTIRPPRGSRLVFQVGGVESPLVRLHAVAGDSLEILLTVLDAALGPRNLSGVDALTLTIADRPPSALLHGPVAFEVLDAAAGTARAVVPATATANWLGRYQAEIRLVDGDTTAHRQFVISFGRRIHA